MGFEEPGWPGAPMTSCSRYCLLAVLCALGCGCRERAAPRPAATPIVARSDRDGGAAPAFEHCARLGLSPRDLRPLRLAGVMLRPHGALLEAEPGAAPVARLALGLLGDSKEALAATLSNVDALVARFRAAKTDAVVLLGGIDARFEGTRAVLLRLRGAAPVLALPGDRESRAGFQAAVDALGADGVDLTRTRALLTSGVALLGVPGYHLTHQLLAGEQGCGYDDRDIAALVELIRGRGAARLLLAHGPPRGSGEAAIDRAFGGVNIGDPLLTRLMREADIRFGAFAHVHEATGRATTRDGRPVGEGRWSSSLLLNVGAVDSVPHEDLAGRWSRGSAALLELETRSDGGRARYRRIELP
jgi:hypothetical protein